MTKLAIRLKYLMASGRSMNGGMYVNGVQKSSINIAEVGGPTLGKDIGTFESPPGLNEIEYRGDAPNSIWDLVYAGTGIVLGTGGQTGQVPYFSYGTVNIEDIKNIDSNQIKINGSLTNDVIIEPDFKTANLEGSYSIENNSDANIKVIDAVGNTTIVGPNGIKNVDVKSNEDLEKFSISSFQLTDTFEIKIDEITIPINRKVIDRSETVKLESLVTYLQVYSPNSALAVSRMTFSIDNSKSDKDATVPVSIKYANSNERTVIVPGRKTFIGTLEVSDIDSVNALNSIRGTWRVGDENGFFRMSENLVEGSAPIDPGDQIVGGISSGPGGNAQVDNKTIIAIGVFATVLIGGTAYALNKKKKK